MIRHLEALAERGRLIEHYAQLREQHPRVPARIVLDYLRDGGGGLTFEQYACWRTTGHTWRYTGVAYGGDDTSYFCEGRVFCASCGLDGDA